MSKLSIKLFGPVQISLAETPLPSLTSPKIHALLAYLAIEPAQAYPREVVAELLWPDRPPGVARQNLRQTLTRLNRGINSGINQAASIAAPNTEPPTPQLLTVTRHAIQMNHQVAQIDALQITNLLAQVKAHGHVSEQLCQPCCEKLAQIATLFQGEFLARLDSDSPAFDEWLHPKQTWFRQEVLGSLEKLAHFFLARQDGKVARAYAEQQIAIDPLHEAAHRQVMLAYTMAGHPKDALQHFERFRQLLQVELGVEPAPETIELQKDIEYERGQQQNSAGAKKSTVQGSRHAQLLHVQLLHVQLRNMPVSSTVFVGREGEITELQALIDNPDCHLLTLLGHGGIGKTRLALEMARRHATKFREGAVFIEVAAVASVEQLPTTIAHGLGYSFSKPVDSVEAQQAELLAYLSSQHLLIILDNLEHLLGNEHLGDEHVEGEREALLTLITRIIQATPMCMTVVTSRQPLHLRAEWIFDVEGLNYPAQEKGNTIADLLVDQFESMQLFVQAMQRINRRFSPTAADTQAIMQICRIVEGTPLALELAASWGRQLSCPQIYSKIVENLDFLSTTMVDVPERHRSIRAVFESSWHQMSSSQQQICAKLSLLRGPFSVAAATAVATAERDSLATLIDRSLLRSSTPFGGEERFVMHELLRQYAYEKLSNNAGTLAGTVAHTLAHTLAETEERYASYFSTFMEARKDLLSGAEVEGGVKAIHEQIANIRTAWQWCLKTHSITLIGQIASGLLRYHTMTNQTEEAISMFGDGIALLRDLESRREDGREGVEAAPVLAEMLAYRARAYYKIARYPEAISHAKEAQTLAAHCGAKQAEVLGALYWGISLINQGKRDEARQKLIESLTLARGVEWPKIESDSLRGLGILAHQEGKIDEAKDWYEQSLAIGQQLDDARGTSACLGNLGAICRLKGDFEQAQRYITQSLAIHQQIGDRSSEGRTLSLMGDLAIDLEEYVDAERRFQQAFEILTEIGEHHYAADAQVGLGECYARQGQANRAVPLWEEALAKYKAAGEMDQILLVQEYLKVGVSNKNSTLIKR